MSVSLAYPSPRVGEQLHPRGILAPVGGVPAHRLGAESALGVRHQDRHAAGRRSKRRHAEGGTVRIQWILLRDLMVVIDEPRGNEAGGGAFLRGVCALE